MNASIGFDGENVLSAGFTLPPAKYRNADLIERFFRGLRDQLAPTPGVLRVAAGTFLPLGEERIAPVVTEDSDAAKSAARSTDMKLVAWPAISSEYLQAMGIPLREGRFFHEEEKEDVAIVSESAARMLWPGQNPIGKRVSRDEIVKRGCVVGVAGDVPPAGLDRPSTPTIYWPYSSMPRPRSVLWSGTRVLGRFREPCAAPLIMSMRRFPFRRFARFRS
jgi:hypothetical protein